MLDLDYLKDEITGERKTSSCSRIAAALGIDCETIICDECKRKEAETIEKLAKNACIMYDVNGEMITFGDYVYYDGEIYMVRSVNGIGIDNGRLPEVSLENRKHIAYLYFERTSDETELFDIPKDRDGEDVKIGDHVYLRGGEYKVIGYDPSGHVITQKVKAGNTIAGNVIIDPEQVTHKKPETDTLEKIKADAIAFYKDYFGCSSPYRYMCDKCPSLIEGKKPYVYYDTLSCIQAKDLDIIRRVQEVYSRV